MTRVYDLDQSTGVLTPHYSLFVAYMLGIFLGLLGGHWFYLGRPKLGVIYFLTVGLFGFGWVVDLFNMPDYVRHKNNPS
mgnify:CR=1 FL=1